AQLSAADLDGLEGLFEGAGHLLCQLEAPPELFVAAARAARTAVATTILNPAPARPLPDEAFRLADILTPNQTELGVLTHLPTESDDQVQRAATVLLERGVGEVVVTLGDRGALWARPDGSQHFPAHQVKARDTTGAGDAFNAGLTAALARGDGMAEAIALGMRAGAFCVTRLGVIDGLPTPAQLDQEVPA
ncbi:MAG: PfkB family carbohydrate kinase, partial [Acidimicrobiia bacterium]